MSEKIRPILFVVLCMFLSKACYAYEQDAKGDFWENTSQEFSIRKYTVRDGLPINSVNYITHHTDGYIYLATNDGLVRFDGVTFTTYTSFNSKELKSNRFEWIGSGANGELWIMDVSGRLYSMIHERIQWIDLKGAITEKLEILSNNQVLITTDSGFLIQRKINGEFERFDDPRTSQEFVNSFVFSGNEIYFLLEDGLYQMIEDEVFLLLSDDEMLLKPDSIFNIIKTKNGALWFLGYSNELMKLSISKEQELYRYEADKEFFFWDFIEKNDSKLIISTDRGYLEFDRVNHSFSESEFMTDSQGYFEDNAWMYYDKGIISKLERTIYIDQKKVLESERRITFLMMDKESSIWVATSGGGIYQISQKKILTIGENIYPNLRNVYGFAEKDNELFVASFEGNIFRISQNGIENWNPENSNLKNIFFRSVFANKDGVVWAGNFNLWSFKNNTWEKDKKYPNDVNQLDVIFEDSQERFWVGTNKELFIRESSGFTQFKDKNGVSLNSVTSVQENEKRVLIFTTTGQGLAILDRSNTFTFIDKKKGLASDLIRDVYFQSNDTLWIATEDKGLNRVILGENLYLKETKEIISKDGLIDNSLHRLIEDEFGFFWINSNKGIMRISKKNINAFVDGLDLELRVESFNELDGLENTEGNGGSQNSGLLTLDGKLLFPNQAGLIYTRPEWHLKDKGSKLFEPIIEELNYSDTKISLLGKGDIVLPKGERSAQIKMTLPHFYSPEKLKIEYLMSGVNTEWQKMGSERLAVFTTLPSGVHTLKVRGHLTGSNHYTETSINVVVPPFFYETFGFILLSILVLIGIIVIGFRFSLVQYRNREKKLNELVNERTDDLLKEKEKTEDALGEIKKLSEAKSQFFTNFTHELRTPLSLILNPLDDMLLRGENSIQLDQNSLLLMKRNAVRLKELVNKLLDVSKLNSGELTFRFQPVELAVLTNQIAHQFTYEFDRRDLEFQFIDRSNKSKVYLDTSAWEHICTNLLSNAIKFTPKKGLIIIEIVNESKYLLFKISDTGLGIPSNEIDYIFDPYFQGDSSISKAGGTGLGLALAKGLIDRMGGTISVVSDPKKGSEFIVRIKKGEAHISSDDIIEGEQRIDVIPNSESMVKEKLSSLLPEFQLDKTIKRRILLVEDNDDYREYLATIIGKEYVVKTANNGKEGLESLDNFDPEIIVSDIMMPEIDGYEMMRSIRSTKVYKHIPFIFLSAKDSAVDIEKGLNEGADIYLTKPVENNLLLTQIRVLLRREGNLKKTEATFKDEELNPLIVKVEEVIYRHLGNPDLSVELIANAIAMSSASLYRNWKAVSSTSINKTITKLRFEEAIKLIKEEHLTISEASYLVGFKQLSYFSRAFKKVYGVSPQEYLSKN